MNAEEVFRRFLGVSIAEFLEIGILNRKAPAFPDHLLAPSGTYAT